MALAHLVREMLAGEYTCRELSDRTGLHYVTVLRYTREMHKAGSAHICAWRMNSQKKYVLKVYKIGSGMDARKLRAPMTHAERSRKYRAKLKRQKHVQAGAQAIA